MEELIVELRKKNRYEIGIGGKRSASAKNAAYHIITEYLPDLLRVDTIRKTFDAMKEGLAEDAKAYLFGDEIRITIRDAEQLKRVIAYMAERAKQLPE